MNKFLLFGEISIYHFFAICFSIILVLKKLGPGKKDSLFGDVNYLKIIFIIYFIVVIPQMYLTIYIKDITLTGLGVGPIAKYFIYLAVLFYVQDIFLKNKTFNQINKIFTILQVLILLRCFWSIYKYLLGYGIKLTAVERTVQLAAENDFCDIFLALLIIALTRYLFNKNESAVLKLLHLISIATTTYIVIFSTRRYFWIESIFAYSIVLFYYFRNNKFPVNRLVKPIMSISLLVAITLSATAYVGPERVADNKYIGRFLTAFSLINPNMESEYGDDQGHFEEIIEGWNNVKNHIFLGITPFGVDLMERKLTGDWQGATFVHNGYLCHWINYGLIAFILYITFYLKSIRLGYAAFDKFNNSAGLVLITFLISQMVKNIVWSTVMLNENVTVIYILLISLVFRLIQLEEQKAAAEGRKSVECRSAEESSIL